MRKNQEEVHVIPFKLLDGFDQPERTAGIFIFGNAVEVVT